MIYILDLLNKIKWDQNLNPEEYTIIYKDRVNSLLKEIKFKNIKSFNNLTIELENREIPLHRIKEIKQDKKIIWKR